MILINGVIYEEQLFEVEKDFELAVQNVADHLFGSERIYLEVKKVIGEKGKTRNIPDAYLIDLSSQKVPLLYVVENEISTHETLRHIAVQILQFSLSFESSPYRIKNILKEAILSNDKALQAIQKYIDKNNHENIDFLLEKMILKHNAFNALVIIDEVADELEIILSRRFKFPVEIVTLKKFVSKDNEVIYQFKPFLENSFQQSENNIDPADIDTLVVPARDEGFNDVFLGEDCWHSVRLNSSMIPKIKYLAVYRVSPISAITHIAKVHSIEPWKETDKYIINFEAPAEPINEIKLNPNGQVKTLRSPRYTSKKLLDHAKSLDGAF